MDKLAPTTALGEEAPRVDVIGQVTITENAGVALASVAARLGKEAACKKILKPLLGGTVPEAGHVQLNDPIAGFWMGPDQWMVGGPIATHELIADQLVEALGDSASVTEQTGAWVVFDVTGEGMRDLCERVCAVPIRQMETGDARRTVIHQLGCFVIKRLDPNHIRILGPRASAKTLHHALVTAAEAIA